MTDLPSRGKSEAATGPELLETNTAETLPRFQQLRARTTSPAAAGSWGSDSYTEPYQRGAGTTP